MFEKICSHCGSTLLVGLQYCPGCLREIQGRSQGGAQGAASRAPVTPAPTDDGPIDLHSLGSDLKIVWANFTYPFRSSLASLRNRPEPPVPHAVPAHQGRDLSQYRNLEAQAPHSMTLSTTYTRVVCPKCTRVQRLAAHLLPSDMVTCERCDHHFPGSFAAEFRKGVDLQCHRCGITTFSVSGATTPECPICSVHHRKVQSQTRVKKGVVAGAVMGVFMLGLTFAVLTHTTPQFVMGFCMIVGGSMLGFVTMVALGF